jgi:pyridoxal phosphate enzyme (YggS family)
MVSISEKIDKVNGAIGRLGQAENVRLVAVSKTVPAEIIKVAYDAGQRVFGENRIDVLVPKVDVLPSDIEWHFIGNLQSRKLRQIIQNSSWIHSVDALDKIGKIDRVCGEENKPVKFLIQVNVSGEEAKHGFTSNEAREAVELALKCENATCCGLMTMAPFVSEDDELREVFAGLRKLRDELEAELNCNLPELSMGMSNDYEIALQEGATMIRVGSSIFA